MLAVVNTPNAAAPVELREVPEPQPAPNEAVIEVRAFSLNRGELRLLQIRPEGWWRNPPRTAAAPRLGRGSSR
jgi:NADPH:quinone reductase